MENDLCQNHLLHNYNMLITYFIKEVYYGAQMKSCRLKTPGGEAMMPEYVSPSLSLFLLSLYLLLSLSLSLYLIKSPRFL